MPVLVFLIILFFPSKHFVAYHLVTSFFLCILVFRSRKFPFHRGAYAVLALIGFVLATSFLRTVTIGVFNPRDYMEAFRFVPILLLLMSQNKLKPYYEIFRKCAFVYLLVDVTVSFLQIAQLDIINPISSIYATPLHYRVSLHSEFRSTGLSSGPGQHATVLALFYIYSLVNIIKTRSKYFWYSLMLSMFGILLSQSQTVFLTIIVITVAVLAYFQLLGSWKVRSRIIKIVSVIGAVTVILVFRYISKLRYLLTLFSEGTERNSFQVRLEKTESIISEMSKNPQYLLTGYGKDYFGPISGAMDNEYLYIFSVYGVIVFTILFVYLLYISLAGLFGAERRYNQSLSFIIFAGLIIAYPISFFTDPRTTFMLILIALFNKEQFVRSETLLLRSENSIS